MEKRTGPASSTRCRRQDVVVMGGGDLIGQCIVDGLLDELRIHLAPIVLGGGTRLFVPGHRQQFTQASVRPSSTATHLTYVVPR